MSLFSQLLILRKIHEIPALRRNAQVKDKSILTISGNKIDVILLKRNCRKRKKMDVSISKSIKIAIYPLLFAATFFSQYANALCISVPNLRVTDFTMDAGNIVVPADATIGQVLSPVFRRNIVPPTGTIARCDANGGSAHYSVRLGVAVPGFDNVYTTNIPGIGYRLKYDFGGNPDPIRERALPFETRFSAGASVVFGNPQMFVLEFIVIPGGSQGGVLFSGNVMDITDDLGGVNMRAFFSANATKFILPSCQVRAPGTIDVLFGKVPQSNFKGRGSVTAERNFDITLNCRAGVGVRNIVYLRMDATKDPAAVGDDGVLQITQGGTSNARGVGIQIVDGNSRTPVKFGDDALVGESKDGDYVLPYTARYFQTGERVTPGQANGTATFTVIYK